MPRVAVISPCYDDFSCVPQLVSELRKVSLTHSHLQFSLLIINDSPWIAISEQLEASIRQSADSDIQISIINLSANLGHQRAIAIGLAKLSQMPIKHDYFVTMDIDGEDDPFLIPSMIRCLAGNQVLACVATRRDRTESIDFQVGYFIYKQITRFLSGFTIDYGNFICFTPQSVQALVRLPYTSIHLAASLIQSRIPFGRVIGDRRARYSGESKMGGYSSLVLHAFRAYSVLGETIAVRLIILTAISLLAIVAAIGLSGFIRLTGIFLVFPGWASIVAVNLISLGIIATFTLFALALTLITTHASFSTTPLALLERYVESEISLA